MMKVIQAKDSDYGDTRVRRWGDIMRGSDDQRRM